MRALSPLTAFAFLLPIQKPDDLGHDNRPAYEPRVLPASDEGRAALARFELGEGLKVELVAAEPFFANPVSFYAANDGSFYIAETFRHHQGVTDIRDHMDWLDDDLAARTVEDRVAYFKKQLGPRFPEIERAFERISRLRDDDGDGVVDHATVFSDKFAGAATGIGAGLLVNGKDVYYTCIPSLWKLRDENGDGRADEQKELSTGYGVHVALLGHDMHGLRIGPDQRLYFSIGDRGFDVTTPSGAFHHEHAGAVLRCELDGSKLEVFATGLRNPQELVFDSLGDLFTGDNNSDGGDRARLVHVVEGGDSGWRQSYQWITEPSLRGPWNDEKLWQPHFEGQAAYIVPPIANFADGPSGLTIDPGTGFSERYRGQLFLCDFRGTAATSGVHAIELEPAGASFSLKKSEHVIWKVLATDCDFGPDGALYVTDWVQGWAQPGKGRLYRVFDPEVRASSATAEVRRVLRDGVGAFKNEELAQLLRSPDQRVRQLAHFELAGRGIATRDVLQKVLDDKSSRIARVHAVWALWVQALHGGPGIALQLLPLLTDADEEIQAQAARALGEMDAPMAIPQLIQLLRSPSPRVRFAAANALGRARAKQAFEPLVALVRETGESDPVLRHAATYALERCETIEGRLHLDGFAKHGDVHVRVAAVVGLRRRLSEAVSLFLGDADARVSTEAARAIYDEPIAGAMWALANSLKKPGAPSYDFGRRALNAAFRGGTQPELLADFAARADIDARLRSEALERLAQWSEPPSRDPVTGHWRPFTADQLAARRVIAIAPLVARIAPAITGGEATPEGVLEGWLKLVERFKVRESGAHVAPLLQPTRPSPVRRAALRALAAIDWPELRDAVTVALSDRDGELRAEALEALTKLSPEDARPLAEQCLASGELRERRSACRILATLPGAEVNAALSRQLDKLRAGLFPVEASFDLLAAARARKDAALDASIAAIEAPRAADAQLAPFLDALFGGDREEGKRVFREKAETNCLRCHKVEWDEGGDVGPDLRGVGRRLSRLQVLESIVAPNRAVSAGFRTTVFALRDEKLVEARVLLEDETKFRVMDANAKVFDIPKSDVEEKRDGISAMPEGFDKLLTPLELRNVIEYLCSI